MISTRDFFRRISNDPLVTEDDDEKIGETDTSTRAISVVSETATVHLQSSHSVKELKKYSCLSPGITGPATESTISPFDPLIFGKSLSERDSETDDTANLPACPYSYREYPSEETYIITELPVWHIFAPIDKSRL